MARRQRRSKDAGATAEQRRRKGTHSYLLGHVEVEDDVGRAWKMAEGHRQRAGGGALWLELILKYLPKCHWRNFINYSQIL
jgi:hypothetical protein